VHAVADNDNGRPPAPAPGARGFPTRRRRLASLLVAAGLSAALLAASLRGVQWEAVAATIQHADISLLFASMTLCSVTLWLRSLRWRTLLTSRESIGTSTVFWATAAGSLANTVFVARSGEIVRTVMVRSERLTVPFVLSTAFFERMADVATLTLFTVLVLFFSAGRPAGLGYVAVGLLSVTILVAALVSRRRRASVLLLNLVRNWPLSVWAGEKIHAAIEDAIDGARTFRPGRPLLSFLLLTAAIWPLDVLATVLGGLALGIAIPAQAAFLLLAYLGLGSVLPSTPGQVGIYQFAAVAALTPFGISRSDAIAYILVAQILLLAVLSVWGTLALWQRNWSFAQLTTMPDVPRDESKQGRPTGLGS
jgi:uncharacterized protein (TIRG00374 family)